jgi:hypothetical protein
LIRRAWNTNYITIFHNLEKALDQEEEIQIRKVLSYDRRFLNENLEQDQDNVFFLIKIVTYLIN